MLLAFIIGLMCATYAGTVLAVIRFGLKVLVITAVLTGVLLFQAGRAIYQYFSQLDYTLPLIVLGLCAVTAVACAVYGLRLTHSARADEVPAGAVGPATEDTAGPTGLHGNVAYRDMSEGTQRSIDRKARAQRILAAGVLSRDQLRTALAGTENRPREDDRPSPTTDT